MAEPGAHPKDNSEAIKPKNDVPPPDFPWQTFAADGDEARRAFVLSVMVSASADIDGATLVANMQAVTEWLRTGNVLPPAPLLRIKK